MEINLENQVGHVLILGAGASVDYELPTWKKLGLLMRKKLNEGTENNYKIEMLAWMDKVGEQKKYRTIDECMTKESVSSEYRGNGYDIEDEIFLVIKEILDEKYKDNEDGWIEILNKKILDNTHLAKKIAFINYNYDSVLYKNFLNFKYLSQKERESTRSNELSVLSKTKAPALFPHDYLFSEKEIENYPCLNIYSNTPKTDNERDINAVSCHDSEHHNIVKFGPAIKLYILGLGEGLQVNLNKISLSLSISEVYVTIKDANKKDEVINFLSEKYKTVTEIQVYDTCKELVEKCFNN